MQHYSTQPRGHQHQRTDLHVRWCSRISRSRSRRICWGGTSRCCCCSSLSTRYCRWTGWASRRTWRSCCLRWSAAVCGCWASNSTWKSTINTCFRRASCGLRSRGSNWDQGISEIASVRLQRAQVIWSDLPQTSPLECCLLSNEGIHGGDDIWDQRANSIQNWSCVQLWKSWRPLRICSCLFNGLVEFALSLGDRNCGSNISSEW